MTYADTQVDKAVLGYLSGLLSQREPGLVATADSELATLDAALLGDQDERAVAVAHRGQPRTSASTWTRPSARCSRRSPPFPTSLKSRPRTEPPAASAPSGPTTQPQERNPVDLSRRKFLKGTATGAAGTALAGGVLIGGAHADANAATQRRPGHRGGVVPVPRRAPVRRAHPRARPASRRSPASRPSTSTAADKAALADLLQTITTRARFLTAGGTPPNLGVSQPPSDSDVLGPVVPADGLTVTLSAGSTLFDDRYGLADRKPLKLKPMTTFPNDSPGPGVAARRPARAALREPPGHDPPRDQGHRQAHPRRHAAALEDRGLQLAAAPVRHRAEPARVQGRHRQPDRHPRQRPDLGRRPGGARLGAERVLPGGAADPDARRVLGPRVDQRAGGDVRPPPGHRRAARRHQRVRHARTTRRTRTGT